MNIIKTMEEIKKSIDEIGDLMSSKYDSIEENEPDNPSDNYYDRLESYGSLAEDLNELRSQIESILGDMRMHQIDYKGLKKFRL